MNLSIAEEFLKFKKIFFLDTAQNREIIFNLKNQVLALNYEVKGLQDQILILEKKIQKLKN